MRNACNAVRFGQLEEVLVVSLNLVESDNVDEWMNAISASNTHVVRNITWRGERHVVGVLRSLATSPNIRKALNARYPLGKVEP